MSFLRGAAQFHLLMHCWKTTTTQLFSLASSRFSGNTQTYKHHFVAQTVSRAPLAWSESDCLWPLSQAQWISHSGSVCRQETYGQSQQWTARATSLQAAASDLDCETATYYLVASLYGEDDARLATAGDGGPKLAGCGDAQTTRQQIADIIAEDEELNRCSAGLLAHVSGTILQGGAGWHGSQAVAGRQDSNACLLEQSNAMCALALSPSRLILTSPLQRPYLDSQGSSHLAESWASDQQRQAFLRCPIQSKWGSKGSPNCRVARVVAWLEASASDALDRDEDNAADLGGAAVSFAPDEGLAGETRTRLLSSIRAYSNSTMVTELDPDAGTRCCLFTGWLVTQSNKPHSHGTGFVQAHTQNPFGRSLDSVS